MEDYTLFPIKKTDVDWPLYHLVRHFLAKKSELKINDGSEKVGGYDFRCLDDDTQQEDKEYSLYLMFPSEDLTVSYSEAMLEQDYLVLKLFFPIEQFEQTIPGQIEPMDDDEVWYEDVPMEYFCFPVDGSSKELQHYKTQIPSQWPDIYYNVDAFLDVLDELVATMQMHHLTDMPWYGRLQTTKRMLEGNANELHILHNAGLYDHATLWSWLKGKGLEEGKIDTIKDSYVSQLKRYAMFALNELDWRWGRCVDENDREKRRFLFAAGPETAEQLKQVRDEQERRLKFQRAKAYRQQKNSMSPSQDTLVECQKTMGELHEAADKWNQENHTLEPAKNDKSNTFALVLLWIFIVVLLVANFFFGMLVNHEYIVLRTLLIAIGGIVAYIAGSKATDGINFRHPLKFRNVLVAVGVVSSILFGWLGNRLARALQQQMSPGTLMVELLMLLSIVILAAALLRRRQTDERKARPYTLAILIAVMALIGHFLGGFIFFQ